MQGITVFDERAHLKCNVAAGRVKCKIEFKPGVVGVTITLTIFKWHGGYTGKVGKRWVKLI